MKPRILILILLLNLAALGAGFVFLSQYLADKAEKEKQREPVKVALGKAAKTIKLAPMPAPVHSNAAPVVVYRTNTFRWNQLESADYRQYIANLRAVGCPESTIKDLILTDVMKLYAARRGQWYHNGREFKFWETDEKRKLKQSQFEQREHQLALIDKELPAVLRELLRINYERELNKYFVDTAEEDRRLAFLSEEKRSQLLVLRDKFESQRARWLETAPDGKLTPAILEQFKEIEKSRDEELGKLLTPEERAKYDLSMSGTADRLRQELIGFNPTETEFREIFRRRQALEAKYAFQDLSDPNVSAAKAAEEAAAETEIRGVIGANRAADYDRAKNPDYRDLTVLGERFDLPQSTCQTLVEIRGLAEAERQKLVANKQITEEVRQRALKAIQAETERTVHETLGEKAFSEYVQGGGGWIQNLGQK